MGALGGGGGGGMFGDILGGPEPGGPLPISGIGPLPIMPRPPGGPRIGTGGPLPGKPLPIGGPLPIGPLPCMLGGGGPLPWVCIFGPGGGPLFGMFGPLP